jgi:putative hemolysin
LPAKFQINGAWLTQIKPRYAILKRVAVGEGIRGCKAACCAPFINSLSSHCSSRATDHREFFMVEVIIILVLILFNGVMAMSELAVISARRPKLQQMAENGVAGAQRALELAASPGPFLSTVQIGITLVGILAGAFGGATVAAGLAAMLEPLPVIGAYATPISVGVVVLIVTYLSLVIGELVPKQIALTNAEGIAARMAMPLSALARFTSPLVHVLHGSTQAVLRLLHIRDGSDTTVSEEEVRLLLAQATEQGVFDAQEEQIVDQVFRLADRKVGALITPRTEMTWLDIHDSPEALRAKVIESGRSRFPVTDGQLDHVLGVILAKDLLTQSLYGKPLDLHDIMRPALFVPESTPALNLVERFKQTHSKLAIVIDEYGGVEGLVTVDDILAAIVGDIPEPNDENSPGIFLREDGSYLIDGLYPIEEFQSFFELKELPAATEGYYQTVGGFVMASLGQVPHPGDYFHWAGLRLEVVDMDGRRVDQVMVSRLPEDTPEEV